MRKSYSFFFFLHYTTFTFQINTLYDIILRKFAKKPLDVEKIESLSGLLLDYGFTDKDFINPIGRTRKLVITIDVINEIEMKTNKTMIKK